MSYADIRSELAVGEVILDEDRDGQDHPCDHYQEQPNFMGSKWLVGSEQFPHPDDWNGQHGEHGEDRTVPRVGGVQLNGLC